MLQIQMEDLGVVRFVRALSGGAPLAIREQWIGVEVPCLYSHDGKTAGYDANHDVISGMKVPDYLGYVILQTLALEALEKKSPEAVEFWQSQGFPHAPLALFIFNLESAEVVMPVPTR